MKTLLKVALGVVVLFLGVIAVVFYLTADLADTADRFFAAVKTSDFETARSFLSEDFKASTNEEGLKDFLSRSALVRFSEASWSNRQISGDRGELEGSVTTDTGGSVPVRLVFVKENGEWKIYSLHKPSAGVQASTSAVAAPSPEEVVALVRQSMQNFAVSVNSQSMEHFRSTVSQLWQRQNSVQALNEAFASVFGKDLDFTVLLPLEPILANAPVIDENGVLLVTGRYATTPSEVWFEHKYVYEGVGWKLLGFSFELK
jgi:hypothetical protein